MNLRASNIDCTREAVVSCPTPVPGPNVNSTPVAHLHVDADAAVFVASGIGILGRSLINGIVQNYPNLRVTAYFSRNHPATSWLESMRRFVNFHVKVLAQSRRERNISELFGIPTGPRVEDTDGGSILYLYPRVAPRTNARQFCIVHDLSSLREPSHSSVPWHGSVLLWRALRCCLSHRVVPIAVSQFTRDDLASYLHRSPNDIHYIYQGLCAEWFAPLDLEEDRRVKAKYSLPERYFAWCGDVNRRKNVDTLLRAYAAARASMAEPPSLVLVGSGKQDITTLIKDLGILECIVRLPFLPLGDLVAVISGCTAFVFPSRYEGFGRPAVEAASRGVPVIVSSSGSLPEIAGPAAIVVSPLDARGLAEAMVQAACDARVSERASRLGPPWAARFCVDRMCGEYLTALFPEFSNKDETVHTDART
jgi:glycosyltransferase involved in cell wall biosynthesis